jgi:hypothetical protein
MEKENWIKWLQARIPTLKESHNEIWLGIALDGYLESKQNQALSMSGVSNCISDNMVDCGNCGEKVEMISTGEICPKCYC